MEGAFYKLTLSRSISPSLGDMLLVYQLGCVINNMLLTQLAQNHTWRTWILQRPLPPL